jgi:CheY-like chemotaxis protein
MNKVSNTKVLVIDDSFVNRQLMKTVLDNHFSEVIEAGDGVEALEILQSSFNPDIVILDLMMPVMDGVETLRRMRELGHIFPVIVLTADLEEENRAKCLELGISGFISKPIQGSQVIKIIKDILSNTNKDNEIS